MFTSLKFRIAVIISLISGALLAVVIWQNIAMSDNIAHRQLATKEEVFASFLEDISRSAILNNEYEVLQLYLDKLRQDPEILHIRAADYRGVVVSSTEPSELGAQIRTLPAMRSDEWRQIKIVNAAGEVGSIAIRFSHAEVDRQQAEVMKFSLLSAVAGLGLLLAAGYFIGHLLTRRLDRLTRAAQAIADGDLTAVRYDNWKLVFMEQRVIGTLQVWAEPFTELRVPKIFNLRTDPYERADFTSNTYWDWMLDHGFLLVPAQAFVAQMAASLLEFPPTQKPATFGISQAMAKLQAGLPSA